MLWRARTRVTLGGEKRKGPEPSRKGIHRNLNIGTESRVNHSLCLGLELHHPIMSKLWNLGGQTSRDRTMDVQYVSTE